MATDIAFTVGVVALLGERIPSPLKVFLLTLAVADDIGAILVIAVFYSGGLSWSWLAAAGCGLLLVYGLRRLEIWYIPVYVALGAAIWYATHESGVHATIAGVALGLLTPARPLHPEGTARAAAERLTSRSSAAEAREATFLMKEEIPLTERLEEALHPWTSFAIVPIFALANAGVPVSFGDVGDALTSSVGLGILLGLVVGKTVGITLASWLAVRLGVGRLPAGVAWPQLVAAAALAGIGFTVSLFITGLAFDDQALRESATLAVLSASAVAALIGSGAAILTGRRASETAGR